MNTQNDRRQRMIYLVAGTVLLICGYGIYLFYRSPVKLIHFWSVSQWLMRVIPHSNSFPQWAGWMPSFVYVLSFSLLSAAALGTGPQSRFLIPIFWATVASAVEAGQYFHPSVRSIVPAAWTGSVLVRYFENYFLHGTFDPLDLAAGFVGMLAAVLVFIFPRGRPFSSDAWRPALARLHVAGGLVVFLLGMACLTADVGPDRCKSTADPVYLSYSDLRQPIAAAAASPVPGGGKIYVYANLILVNERNQGIHVIDNTNPQSPINLLFLPIPGNLDMAAKEGVLYADSYVDLVAIDISNVYDIHEINRVQSVFTYDPYQNIQNLSVCFCSSYDPSKGVIVDYIPR